MEIDEIGHIHKQMNEAGRNSRHVPTRMKQGVDMFQREDDYVLQKSKVLSIFVLVAMISLKDEEMNSYF